MATNFPTNIDTFTDQTSSDLITSAKWNNLQDSIEALEEKVGADNSDVITSHDYKLIGLATSLGVVQTTLGGITSAIEIADLEKLHGITSSATEINQLHESGVVKADLEKLHGITSSATEINQLHESGVVKADLVKLHDIIVEAARINTIGKIKARAYRNAAQNIAEGSSSTTKILIDTISRDTEGVVDTTNSRIIPNLPGDYIVMVNVRVVDVREKERVTAMIYKNGELVTYGTIDNQGAFGLSSSSASDLIYMNGTTDYLELHAFKSQVSALDLYTGFPYQNYISIVGPF